MNWIKRFVRLTKLFGLFFLFFHYFFKIINFFLMLCYVLHAFQLILLENFCLVSLPNREIFLVLVNFKSLVLDFLSYSFFKRCINQIFHGLWFLFLFDYLRGLFLFRWFLWRNWFRLICPHWLIELTRVSRLWSWNIWDFCPLALFNCSKLSFENS